LGSLGEFEVLVFFRLGVSQESGQILLNLIGTALS
jgi:hypothetical protein